MKISWSARLFFPCRRFQSKVLRSISGEKQISLSIYSQEDSVSIYLSRFFSIHFGFRHSALAHQTLANGYQGNTPISLAWWNGGLHFSSRVSHTTGAPFDCHFHPFSFAWPGELSGWCYHSVGVGELNDGLIFAIVGPLKLKWIMNAEQFLQDKQII